VDAALEKLSKLTKALEVGTSGIGAVVAYYTLVPEQLALLGAGAFLIGGLGVVTSWLERRWLRRHAVKIVLAAGFFLVSLLLINLWVVEEVQYSETASGRPSTSHLLVGTQLSAFGEETARRVGSTLPSEIIREAGKDLIPKLWTNYRFFAAVYVICFMLLSFSGAMAVAAVVDRVTVRTR
jgi:hypothetical protein